MTSSFDSERELMNIRLILASLSAFATLCLISEANGGQIFVTNIGGDGSIGLYTTSGATVNPALVSGLNGPYDITVSGDKLFVVNTLAGTIGEYTTSGETVNPALISGLHNPSAIAVSGENLFVASGGNGGRGNGTIGVYTTSGATVNATLVSRLTTPNGIAISGENLFVTNTGADRIDQYTTSGATVNRPLISGVTNPTDIAMSGDKLFVTGIFEFAAGVGEYTTSGAIVNPLLIAGGFFSGIAVVGENLFVTDDARGTIGEYTTSGETVNAALVSGLNQPIAIAVVSESVPVPDVSSTWTLLLLGLMATFGLKPLLRRLA
jgi:hypothetical protein